MKIDTPNLDTNEFDKFIQIEYGIWQNTTTNKYVFEDETQNFSNEYDTIEECRQAARDYGKYLLGY